jgi:phosphoribosylanthranilate isomerase
MNIKVSGITSMKQLQQLDGLEVDFAGLDFYKPSPRYVADKIAEEEIRDTDLDVKKVGVFVNSEYDEIMETVERFGLDLVQLNGDESPHLCEAISGEIEVIKAFRIGKTDKSIDYIIKEYDEVCDYYLFDTVSKLGFSGTGEKFDWKKIETAKIEKPFFLSGGISPDDANIIKKLKHPDFYGIDINSQFEKSPGVKDMVLVLKFMHALRTLAGK